MTDVIASKALGLADKLKDRNEPAVAEMTRRLRKYAEAEKGLAGSVHAMGHKATGLVVYGLHVADWAKKNKGPEADAFKKREKDFAKVVDSFEALGDAVDALLEGGTPAKVKLPGNAMQKMLDNLQFKDQVKVANLHKAALDYYPAESAGQKKLQEWAVQLNHLCAGLNDGLSQLDAADLQAFGRKEVLERAQQLKKSIDTMGV